MQLVRRDGGEALRVARNELRRPLRKLTRYLKGVLLMVVAAFVIIPTMIVSGMFLGPNGTEGLLLTPLVLIATWAAILYWTLRREPPRKIDVAAKLPQLPLQAEAWLLQERTHLPRAAQDKVHDLLLNMRGLDPQLQRLAPDEPAALEVRKLLTEELPELITHYRKVPREMAQQPLYGGKTPENQLLEGLATVDEHLARVKQQLAQEHMHALATHQRYLELKYKRDEEEKK